MISLAQRVGGLCGALLAGGIVPWWGSSAAFSIMTISYFLGALALYWLRHAGDAAPPSREAMAQNLLNYFRVLRDNRPEMESLDADTEALENR